MRVLLMRFTIPKRWLIQEPKRNSGNSSSNSVQRLPPKFSGAPAEIQAELRALQSLSTAELQTVAARQVPQARQARHLALLEKNSRGTITDVERAELVALRTEADRLMLCRAYAWALLRWRGVPVPDLDDLPLPK